MEEKFNNEQEERQFRQFQEYQNNKKKRKEKRKKVGYSAAVVVYFININYYWRNCVYWILRE